MAVYEILLQEGEMAVETSAAGEEAATTAGAGLAEACQISMVGGGLVGGWLGLCLSRTMFMLIKHLS